MVRKGAPDPASPELQESECRRLADSLGLAAAEVYRDAEGHRSGRSASRPGLTALLERARGPDVAAVIVYKYNRLARQTRLLLKILADLQEIGVAVYAVQSPVDASTPQGYALLTVSAAFDQMLADETSQDRRASIAWLRRQHGQHLGVAPFGTERRLVDGRLRLAPSSKAQANGTDYDCLLRLYTLYAAGEAGYTNLTAQLNREGWRFRSPEIGVGLREWQYSDVRRCLHNHWLYAGWIVSGRKGSGGEYELIKGNHGAVLPEALTQRAAGRLAGHKRGWRLARNLEFPLTGLVVCEACGLRLAGLASGERRYYRHARRCDAGGTFAYAANDLHDLARARIGGLRLPATLAAKITAGLAEALAGEHGRGGEAERAHVQGQLERARDLYVSGDIDRADYDRRKAKLAARLAELERAADEPPAEFVTAAELLGMTARNADLQAAARLLYAEIRLAGATRAFDVEWVAREWCRGWA